MSKKIETAIVGGGQAGLSVSYYLTQCGRSHIVLEKATAAANSWRNHRWNSFTLNTPNWQSKLPGMNTPGADLDGFLSRERSLSTWKSMSSDFSFQFSMECAWNL